MFPPACLSVVGLLVVSVVVCRVGAGGQEGDAPVGFVGRGVLVFAAPFAGGRSVFVVAGVFACQAVEGPPGRPAVPGPGLSAPGGGPAAGGACAGTARGSSCGLSCGLAAGGALRRRAGGAG